MKNNAVLSILTLAGATLVASSVDADAVIYVDGDLFLGFRATGGVGATETYLINIGQASIFRDAAPGSSFTLSLGNIGTDLDLIFGDGTPDMAWYLRDDVVWGVVGMQAAAAGIDPVHTLYATKDSPTGDTLATAWVRRSNSQQTTTETKIQNLVQGYTLDNEGSANTNSAFAIRQNTTDSNNWSQFQPGGTQSNSTTSFSVWNPTIEGNFDGGVINAELDLFRMTPNGTAGTPGTYEGTFTIAQNGTVTYSVVPEPTSAALLSLSVGLLGFARRRRVSTHA